MAITHIAMKASFKEYRGRVGREALPCTFYQYNLIKKVMCKKVRSLKIDFKQIHYERNRTIQTNHKGIS